MDALLFSVLGRIPSDIIFFTAENFDDAGLLLCEWFLKIKAHCWKVTSDLIVSVTRCYAL